MSIANYIRIKEKPVFDNRATWFGENNHIVIIVDAIAICAIINTSMNMNTWFEEKNVLQILLKYVFLSWQYKLNIQT